MKQARESVPASTEESRDLGFGAVVARESRQRLLNHDGSFNVIRTGLSFWASLSPYHALLTMPWGQFMAIVVAGYFATNAVFATAYLLCGDGALVVPDNLQVENPFWQAFFFSVATMATIGYGNITPAGIGANILVSLEALFGLLGFALVTGLLFARFSRPTARILFSKRAVIAPYREMTALEFRVTNALRNQIIELEAKVLLAIFEGEGEKKIRRFYPLKLEREKVVFFPLSWTIVHPIDETSPLFGMTEQQLLDARGEILTLLTGIDDSSTQTVHARSSYLAEEVVWHAKFGEVFNRPASEGLLSIDLRKLDSIEMLESRRD